MPVVVVVVVFLISFLWPSQDPRSGLAHQPQADSTVIPKQVLPCLGPGKEKQEARTQAQSSGFRQGQPARVSAVKSDSGLWLHPLSGPQASRGWLGQPITLSRSFGISFQPAYEPNFAARSSHFHAFYLPFYSLCTPSTNPPPGLGAHTQVSVRSLSRGSLCQASCFFPLLHIASSIR